MVNAKTQQGGYYPILQTGTQRSGKAEALFKVEEQESISEKCLLQKKKKSIRFTWHPLYSLYKIQECFQDIKPELR